MTQVRLYLPQNADNVETTLTTLKKGFSRRYGGYTVYEATGGWINDSNDLIKEPVYVIESFTGKPTSDVIDQITGVAKSVRNLTNEKEVMYTVDNEAFFV